MFNLLNKSHVCPWHKNHKKKPTKTKTQTESPISVVFVGTDLFDFSEVFFGTDLFDFYRQSFQDYWHHLACKYTIIRTKADPGRVKYFQ